MQLCTVRVPSFSRDVPGIPAAACGAFRRLDRVEFCHSHGGKFKPKHVAVLYNTRWRG